MGFYSHRKFGYVLSGVRVTMASEAPDKVVVDRRTHLVAGVTFLFAVCCGSVVWLGDIEGPLQWWILVWSGICFLLGFWVLRAWARLEVNLTTRTYRFQTKDETSDGNLDQLKLVLMETRFFSEAGDPSHFRLSLFAAPDRPLADLYFGDQTRADAKAQYFSELLKLPISHDIDSALQSATSRSANSHPEKNRKS